MKTLLDYDEMGKALASLGAKIGTSELLMSVAPLRLITKGGCIAVRLCKKGVATYNIDCLLDPNVAAAEEHAEEFASVVAQVAQDNGYQDGWLNQQVELFVAKSYRQELFLRIGDAAAVIRLMKKIGEPPISFKYLCGLNFNGFDLPPTQEALEKIAKCYIDKYGEVGIAEMIWDEEANEWKYRDVDGSWACC